MILVDDTTKSSAELMAAALQENKRAILVGTRTYGKGTTQRVHVLNGTVLRITTGYFYTPTKKPVDKIGLTPDIKINSAKKQLQAAITILREKMRMK